MTSAGGTSSGKTTAVDVHVGARIRLRRNMLGLSSMKLADALGITWQQIGNYERGRDRIGASSLYLVASVLGVQVDSFFEGLPGNEPTNRETLHLESSEHADLLMGQARPQHSTSELIGAYWKITDPNVRKSMLDLVQMLYEQAHRYDDHLAMVVFVQQSLHRPVRQSAEPQRRVHRIMPRYHACR
jgi:transcriptional regulator with XRE-family HTH domain